MKDEILCKYDTIFLGVLHLREIKLFDCLFDLDFSLSFCKSIRFNMKRIESFQIYSLFYYKIFFKNDLKFFFIILNAIQFCTKIKCLSFEPEFNESKSTTFFPKSFFNFLLTCNFLKTIFFKNLIFDDYMNFNSFKGLISLQTLQLHYCCFHYKILLYCLLNNIPNLNELMLSGNKIKCNFINIKLIEKYFKFKKTIKIPPVLVIDIFVGDFIENSIFQDLIQFDNIKVKNIQISICENSYPRILNFVNFLKCSNLQFLEIDYLKEVEGCNCEEFYNYLKNTQFLMGLKLTNMLKENSDFGLLLQCISVNKSIKVLFFGRVLVKNFSFGFINLILTNQYIVTLILHECFIEIDVNFVEALSKNKALYCYI